MPAIKVRKPHTLQKAGSIGRLPLTDMTCGLSDLAIGGLRAEAAGRGLLHEQDRLTVYEADAGRTIVDAASDMPVDFRGQNGPVGTEHGIVGIDRGEIETHGIRVQYHEWLFVM